MRSLDEDPLLNPHRLSALTVSKTLWISDSKGAGHDRYLGKNTWNRLFTRNGKGLYERLKPDPYLRFDELDEADEIEGCQHLAEQADAPLSHL